MTPAPAEPPVRSGAGPVPPQPAPAGQTAMTDTSTPPVSSLDALRREIDAADAEMHRLLMHRATVIERLIEAKKLGEHGAAFRPDREAAMMRRLAERHAGALPLSSVEHLWREIIGTFTQLQAPYRVLAARADEPRLRDLLRYGFGFSSPLHRAASDTAAVAEVAATGRDLAVVALDAPLEERWWTGMDGSAGADRHGAGPGAKVIAALPFLPPGTALDLPPALVVGPADVEAPEETCIYAVALKAPASATALEGCGILLAHGPAGALLASPRRPAEIDAVLAPASAAVGTVTPIGSVATPFNWKFGSNP